MQSANLTEIFFRVAAVISDSRVDLIASGRDKGHQCAEAVPLQGNPSGRFWQLNSSADRFQNIFHARIAVIGRVKSQTVLPVDFRSYAQINARLLTPEQI